MNEQNIISPLDNKSLLLGITENSKTYQTINFIVLLAKKYIHDIKITSQDNRLSISFYNYLMILKQQLQYEKEICIKNNSAEAFNTIWQWLDEQL